jgi:hypothetical protein
VQLPRRPSILWIWWRHVYNVTVDQADHHGYSSCRGILWC